MPSIISLEGATKKKKGLEGDRRARVVQPDHSLHFEHTKKISTDLARVLALN
jgi:hypothetical protein